MSQHQGRPAGPAGFARRLFARVDIASLVYFRIAFGGIMVWEVYRYLSQGRVSRFFLEPSFHFTYFGFDWVRPWPGDGLYIHFWLMGLLATFIAIGFLYRLSAALFFLAFTYIFLLEQAQYLNHFYFVSLVAFLMILVPANRAFSVDARMRGSSWASTTTPAWSLWILQAQMGFVYFFAGVAKLNGDWLRGYPMRDWLGAATGLPLVGPYMQEPWVAVGMSWGGAALDLFIVPALLWHRARPFAFTASLIFHLLNAAIFNIGIFPWFSIAATLLFFSPDWPRRLLRRPARAVEAIAPAAHFGGRERLTAAFVVVYVAIQIAVPLRHFLYPGNVSWTEEGHRFAWHQKLRSKHGYVRFLLTDPATGESWTVDPRHLVTQRQYVKMVDRPYMILQFAHHLSAIATEEGKPPVQVRVSAMNSLNGREMQPLVNSTVDLAAQPKRFLTPHPWVLPLEVPLEAQWDGKSPPKHPATLAAIEKARARFAAEMGEDLLK